MQRIYFVFITLIFSLFSFAQDFSTLWQGHFSYNHINEVILAGNNIYASSDNAIFRLNIESNDITEFNTINGLSGESISTFHYSETYGLLIIGYENGLIEIAFDNGEDILTVVDIIDKTTIQPNDKRINHFNEFQNILYISTNYGISVFNLERLEFGDSYFIGGNGTQIKVNQTTVFNNNIYAACSDGNGIKKASISNPNLIDFRNWETFFNGSNYLHIESTASNLYAIELNRRLYEIEDSFRTEILNFSDIPLDLNYSSQNFIITTQNNVFVYDEDFNLGTQVNIESEFPTQYTSSILASNSLYIGSRDYGVLKTSISNTSTFEEIHPDGPLMNVPFSIQAEPNGVWVTFGEYTNQYNPYPLNNRGFSHLSENQWVNTSYQNALEAKCLNSISINPSNTSQVFISSFFSGLLEVNEELPTHLFNEQNSGLESLILPNNPSYIDVRIGQSSFDNNGTLWLTSGLVRNHLKAYNPTSNQWVLYNLDEVIPDAFDCPGFGDIVIGNDQTKWLGTAYDFGFIGFNETNGNKLIKNVFSEEQNMPSHRITALALDNRNQLWIGTDRGLRVLFNTSNFFEEEDIRVNEIIIEEDGIAKELLFQQYIRDIKVDGSNNKWIGTADSGLFYFSSDGQNTIHHFTQNNSPLPSNTINDISIDDSNGIVYIATSRGLVSFSSGGSSPLNDLTNAYAYPNPVRPNFNIVTDRVKIKDISENVNIKITDIEGNLVAEAQSRVNQRYRGYNLEIDGGTAYWNGKNLANNIVASGVYLIMLSDLDTFETNVIKLMVVR